MNIVDQHVGMRLRLRREALGATQQDAADALGITVARLAELEDGTARMLPRSMFDACGVFGVGVAYWFVGLESVEAVVTR